MATEQEKVEQLKKQEDVRKALKQTAGNKEAAKPVVETKQKVWFGTYLLLLAGLGSYLITNEPEFSVNDATAIIAQQSAPSGPDSPNLAVNRDRMMEFFIDNLAPR